MLPQCFLLLLLLLLLLRRSHSAPPTRAQNKFAIFLPLFLSSTSQLPWDGLDAVSEQVKLVTDARVQLIEERRLRPSYVPPLSPRHYQYSSGTGGDSTEEPGSPQGHDDSEEAEGDAEAAARRREKQPWFARNVVDHRCS